jgi:CheY-like chemotaxis protein
MPQGGRLSVTARNIDNGVELAPQLRGPHLVLTAADTGVGIAPEHVSRIFDPFFTTKGPAVSGLGLSQVYGFAARSGGAALASSVLGSGTMITLALPRTDLPADATSKSEAQASTPHLTVLVVDDEPSVAEAVANMLQNAGHHVETANSAANGLRMLATGHHDLLVTDITMPGISGLDFALEARRRYPQLGVVLMSGYSTQLETGAQHPFAFLSKPFSEQELLARLDDEVQRRRALANVVSIEEGRRS